MFVLLTLFERELFARVPYINIFERSIVSAWKVFVKVARLNETIYDVDLLVLKHYYNYFKRRSTNLDLIVYIRTSPGFVHERFQHRGRFEEETIPLQYLELVHTAHENWISRERNTRFLVIVHNLFLI